MELKEGGAPIIPNPKPVPVQKSDKQVISGEDQLRQELEKKIIELNLSNNTLTI